jgi:hypothetical protein
MVQNATKNLSGRQMKKLLLLLVVVLPGCAVYDAVMMTSFDANEYRIVTEIRVDAGYYKTECGNTTAQSNASAMARKTELFERYSEQIPHNQDSYDASRNLNEIAQGLLKRYANPPVPELFCKLKYGAIESSAKVIQHVLAQRPR